MAYVKNNLMKNEEIVYQAYIHWFIFIPGIIFLILGVTLLGIGLFLLDSGTEYPPIVFGAIFTSMSIFSLIKSFLKRISTELAVTSKRVISKTGLISRNTAELNHSKVESFSVEQSIVGRIFSFGTLIINGTGGGKTIIKGIDDPLKFRREAMEVIDAS